MELKEYMEKAWRTCPTLGTRQADNVHMLFGMLTEAGELTDIFKKNLAYKKPIDWVNAQEEVGDLMWYIVNFCYMNNFDLGEILATNIAKLKARYPEKFTEEKANNRDLGKEREILENGSK
jgi:NTP pyrophosphatase (non-canonical NTP hydrolase)